MTTNVSEGIEQVQVSSPNRKRCKEERLFTAIRYDASCSKCKHILRVFCLIKLHFCRTCSMCYYSSAIKELPNRRRKLMFPPPSHTLCVWRKLLVALFQCPARIFSFSRVLFDGAHLKRKGLIMGWLVATAAKAAAFFSFGVMFSFLVPGAELEEGTEEAKDVAVGSIR